MMGVAAGGRGLARRYNISVLQDSVPSGAGVACLEILSPAEEEAAIVTSSGLTMLLVAETMGTQQSVIDLESHVGKGYATLGGDRIKPRGRQAKGKTHVCRSYACVEVSS